MNFKKSKNFTVDISLIAMFAAIICICSWISIPFMGVPFSLQTFAIFSCIGVLGTRRSILSVLLYLALGMIGLPVFSGFRSGMSAIIGPTGGFLVGFVFAVIVTGMVMKILPSKKLSKMIAMFTGQIACYTVAMIWYSLVYLESSAGFYETFSICVTPFVIPDIIKVVLAVFLSDSVAHILKKQNIDIK